MCVHENVKLRSWLGYVTLLPGRYWVHYHSIEDLVTRENVVPGTLGAKSIRPVPQFPLLPRIAAAVKSTVHFACKRFRHRRHRFENFRVPGFAAMRLLERFGRNRAG